LRSVVDNPNIVYFRPLVMPTPLIPEGKTSMAPGSEHGLMAVQAPAGAATPVSTSSVPEKRTHSGVVVPPTKTSLVKGIVRVLITNLGATTPAWAESIAMPAMANRKQRAYLMI
jgi:hypothetical protein